MKYTCNKCGETANVPERDILAYIKTAKVFRHKIAKLLGSIGGTKGGGRCMDTMTPEQRSDRARKAVAAREEKRKNRLKKRV